MATIDSKRQAVSVLIITEDYRWGRGETLEQALVQARKNGSSVTKTGKTVAYGVLEFGDDVDLDSISVDGMGRAHWRKTSEDVSGEPLAEYFIRKGKRTEGWD